MSSSSSSLSSQDVPLIITVTIVVSILFLVNLRFVYYYIDKEVTKYHYVSQFVLLLGMLFAECTILLFPLDIANRSGSVNCDPSVVTEDNASSSSCGSFDIILAWQIIYGIIGACLVVVIPFYIFFYEHYDENMVNDQDSGKDQDNRNPASSSSRYTPTPRNHQSCRRRSCGYGNCTASLKVAFMYTSIILVILSIILFVSYSYVSRVHIPVSTTMVPFSLPSAWSSPSTSVISVSPAVCSSSSSSPLNSNILCICGSLQCLWSEHEVIFHSTFIIYMATLLSFVGWFMFSIYTGIGFMALPLQLIQSFLYRPRMLSSAELRLQKQALNNRSQELIKIGEGIAERIFMKHDQTFLQHHTVRLTQAPRGNDSNGSSSTPTPKTAWLSTWGKSSSSTPTAPRRSSLVHGKAKLDNETKLDIARLTLLVNALEKDTDTLACSDPKIWGSLYNPLWPYVQFVLGIFSTGLSILWILHIIIFLLFQPALHPFLNKAFILLEQTSLSILPAVFIAILGLYLLCAASKGAAVLGSRLFLIDIHPLVPHNTLLNSLFFNLGLVYLCILPTTQLLSDAFVQFGRASDATMIFGVQFRYTEGMLYFWRYNVFLFTILGFGLLSILYFSIFPTERRYVAQLLAVVKHRHQIVRQTLEKEIHRQGGTVTGNDMKQITVKA